MNRFLTPILLCALLMLWVGGCDHRPRLSIEGGTVPRFNLMGRGNIQIIVINGPDLARQPVGADLPQPMKVYWELVPNGDYDLRNLEERGPLIYGQVPEGLRQNYPPNGVPPEALFEKGLFTFQLRTANGDALGARFTIHEGKVLTERS
jgi:hypothetical protein